VPLEFRETFQVHAPVERVWRFLLDPAQVVHCIPGARLTDKIDEHTYAGEITAKVGPITTTYFGRATFVDVDETAHRAKITGQGSETTGSGSARLTLTAEVAALDDGRSEVRLSASVDVVGRVMQFGRAMVEGVARQVIRQFVGCVRTTVEAVSQPVEADDEVEDERAPEPPPPAPAPVRPLMLLVRALLEMILNFFRRARPHA
jgi:carbon monoxide dehydrogenase subunit G